MEISQLIKKIDFLELEFDLFNSRILELAKSTNQTDIDKSLLKQYINSINKYLTTISNYKKETLKLNSSKEYESQKKLIEFRLNTLEKIFNNTLKKLKLISESLWEQTNKIKSNIKTDFHSRNEMITINKNLYDFYNNYNKNLDFQKKYNIKITLDDKFENYIEKNTNSITLTEQENKYMLDLNQVFEEIEELDLLFLNTFKKTIKLKTDFFDNFSSIYFPKKKDNFILKTFKENLKDDYINNNFNIKSNLFYKDFIKFKRKIVNEYNNLKILIDIYNYTINYNNFLILNNKYNLFNNTELFNNINQIYKTLINQNFKTASEAIKHIPLKNIDIKFYNKILIESLSLIKNYKLIKDEYINSLDFWFFWNLYSLLQINNISNNYIESGLNNIRENLNKDINNLDINNKNYLKNFYNILSKYNKNIIKIKNNLINLNNYIKNNIIFSSNNSVKRYLNTTNTYFKNINNSFYFQNKSILSSQLKRYLYDTVKSKYTSSKTRYYANLKAKSYISSYGSSWYSSSSSNWGSSSGSFSSSYSSSWSSSW